LATRESQQDFRLERLLLATVFCSRIAFILWYEASGAYLYCATQKSCNSFTILFIRNSPTKKEGADFEMNKREIPLAFISVTRAAASRLYGSNNFGCWTQILVV